MIALCLCFPIIVCAQSGAESLYVERPKVGLVLSGGGARGAAHIGVVRLIEELGIPIDYVAGTSMGAIIGALYAIGYTADEMDSLLMVQDWRVLLSNSVPRTMQPYAQRVAEHQYQINIPYKGSVRTENSARYRDAGLNVNGSVGRVFPKVLARPGLIDGNNLLNKFTELTFAYHDSVNFKSFPRPFACVATDLVSGSAVVLDRGFLAEAMRASMSIPGVFYPIYKDQQVLVDGGVVNNYPVDVVRRMGADIVIGVDLNTSTATARELHTFASIFERLVGAMGADLHERNVRDTDILITPQVSHFPVMGFDSARLGQLIGIGYEAALQNKSQLLALQQHLSLYASLATQSKYPIPLAETSTPFVLDNIHVLGYEPDALLSLLKHYGVAVGNPINAQKLSVAMERLYGLGTFSSVQYHLMGDTTYTLELNVVPNPSNQVELGLRLDSEDAAAALLSIGVGRLNLSGPRFDFTTQLSINPWVEGRVAYAWQNMLQLNASVKYWFSDVNRFYDKSSHAFDYHFYGGEFYLSNLLSHTYDLRLGVRYDYFRVQNLLSDAFPSQSYTDVINRYSHIGFYTHWRSDCFDTAYLPSKGYAYGAEAAYYVPMGAARGTSFGVLQSDASVAFRLSRNTVLKPAFYVRMLLGDNIPFVYANSLGGYLDGRYMRQQISFVGLTGCEFVQRQLALLRLDARQKLMSNLYLSAIVNYAYSTEKLSNLFVGEGMWGVAAGFIYSTTAGPLSLYTHWNDMHHRIGAYFSFGYAF